MYYKVSGEVSGNLESVEYGIDLSVIPQFLANNTICNTLTMTLSFPVTQGGTSDLSLDKYTIESTIVCKEGQSIIISGIAEQIEDDQSSHTPLLGSIPLVRLLFSNSTRTFKNSEIIAIITPRVMNAELHNLRMQNADPRVNTLGNTLTEADLQASLENITIEDKASKKEAALAEKKAQQEAAVAQKNALIAQKKASAAAKKAAAEAKKADKEKQK